MTIAPEFEDCCTTSVFDTLFNFVDDDMKWQMWLDVTSRSDRDFIGLANTLNHIGYDMETWIAAIVSYRKALMGELEWVVLDYPR